MTLAGRRLTCRPKGIPPSAGGGGSLPAGALFNYDASQITGQTDASGLASWPDGSGNAHDLTAVTAGTHGNISTWHEPTYYDTSVTINGLPVVKFDGSGSGPGGNGCLMISDAFTMTQPWTLFFVVQGIGLTSGSHAVFFDDQSTGGTANGGVFSNQWYEYAGSVLGVGTVDNSPHVITFIADGSSSQVWQDSTDAAGSIGGTPGFSGGLTLGGQSVNDSAGISLWASCYMGQVVGYDSLLSPSDVSAAQAALKSKWGTP